MSVVVETGGPISGLSPAVGPEANTFSDLVLQIADEIDDTTQEYSGQIQNAIFGAIRFCEREVYYFNETRDVTFTTVSGRDWYDGSDNTNITTLVRVVAAYCERSDGQKSLMARVTPEEIEVSTR